MSKIKVKLPDNSVKEISKGTTAHQVARSIGHRLANSALVAKIDTDLKDLSYRIEKDCNLKFLTGDTPEGHETLLHSAAHLMAQAVKFYWPEAKLTIGPAIENKFYYDFDIDFPFSAIIKKIIGLWPAGADRYCMKYSISIS